MKNKNFISKYLSNEKIGVIGVKLVSIIFLYSYSYVNAQPLWEGLSVDKFYRENKEIYLQKIEKFPHDCLIYRKEEEGKE